METKLLLTVLFLICMLALATPAPQELARSRRSPQKKSSNPMPGQNMDRSLGMKKKSQNKASSSSKYPWDPASSKQITLHYTDTMKAFIKPEEEQWKNDYYDEYDFEFPKGMVRNDVFEIKKKIEWEKRLKDGTR